MKILFGLNLLYGKTIFFLEPPGKYITRLFYTLLQTALQAPKEVISYIVLKRVSCWFYPLLDRW